MIADNGHAMAEGEREKIARLVENFHYWQGVNDLADGKTKKWLAAAIRGNKSEARKSQALEHLGPRWTIEAVQAEMLAVATADDEGELAEEWPLDCRSDVDRWQAVIREALATTPPATNDAIPAGWKLVPETPTETMNKVGSDAAFQADSHGDHWVARASAAWSAMLAAAPKPSPTPKGGLPGRGEVQYRTDMDAAKHGRPVVLNSDSPLWRYPFVGFWNAATGWWDFSDPNLSGCFAVSELVNQWLPLPDTLAPVEAIRDGGEGGEAA